MRTHRRRAAGGRGGFTIVELMFVLLILAVLLALAVPSLREFQRSSDLRDATNSLVAAINAARTEAMRQGTPTLVTPLAGNDWAKGWRVFVDKDVSGTLGAGDAIVLERALRADADLVFTGSGTAGGSNDKYLRFDGSGYSRTNQGAFSAATIAIQRGDLAGAAGARYVKVATTGRTRSCMPSGDSDCGSLED